MKSRCSICRRRDCADINAQLAAGVPLRNVVSAHNGISKSSLERHASHAKVSQPAAVAPPASASPAEAFPSGRSMAERLARFCSVQLETIESNASVPLLDRTRAANALSGALVRLGTMTGEVGRVEERDIIKLPAFDRVAKAMSAALADFPDARRALADSLEALARQQVRASA